MAEQHLQDRPSEVMLVLGPKSSGKSAFFEEYRLRMEVAEKQSFIAVDCRKRNLRGPQDMGRALGMDSFRILGALPKNLRKLMENAWPFLRDPKLSKKVADLTVSFPELKALVQREVKSIDEVLAFLEDVVEACAQEQAAAAIEGKEKYPVVIWIDEVNKLAEWGDEQKKDLQAILDWLVWVSKQKRLAHVVLATSESAFEDWLNSSK